MADRFDEIALTLRDIFNRHNTRPTVALNEAASALRDTHNAAEAEALEWCEKQLRTLETWKEVLRAVEDRLAELKKGT